MKVYIETFGCKVNFYESAAILKLFEQKGFETADSFSDADVVVINCCTVTGNADRKERESASCNRHYRLLASGIS